MNKKSAAVSKPAHRSGRARSIAETRERLKAAKRQLKQAKAQLKLARDAVKAAKHERKQAEKARRVEQSPRRTAVKNVSAARKKRANRQKVSKRAAKAAPAPVAKLGISGRTVIKRAGAAVARPAAGRKSTRVKSPSQPIPRVTAKTRAGRTIVRGTPAAVARKSKQLAGPTAEKRPLLQKSVPVPHAPTTKAARLKPLAPPRPRRPKVNSGPPAASPVLQPVEAPRPPAADPSTVPADTVR
jgi:hypothetical protein